MLADAERIWRKSSSPPGHALAAIAPMFHWTDLCASRFVVTTPKAPSDPLPTGQMIGVTTRRRSYVIISAAEGAPPPPDSDQMILASSQSGRRGLEVFREVSPHPAARKLTPE